MHTRLLELSGRAIDRVGVFFRYTFERPIVTTEANHFDLSDTNSYYFLFALNYNGKGKHSTKGASGSATSFASTVAATGVTSKFSSEQKIAHGIMMILAWVFLSPVATFTARFTKEILPAWKWFKTHMIMQIAAVTLTVRAANSLPFFAKLTRASQHATRRYSGSLLLHRMRTSSLAHSWRLSAKERPLNAVKHTFNLEWL